MSTKDVKYTEKQVAFALATYNPEGTQAERDAQVQTIADETGNTVQSVRAKLSREGVYVSKAVTQKAKTVSKADLVEMVADEVGVTSDLFESLEKANKAVLERIVGAFLDRDGEFEVEEEVVTS